MGMLEHAHNADIKPITVQGRPRWQVSRPAAEHRRGTTATHNCCANGGAPLPAQTAKGMNNTIHHPTVMPRNINACGGPLLI